MQLINNAEEFKEFYPYKSPPNPEPCPKLSDYPKRYPCICSEESMDGGLGGDYWEISYIYIPEDCKCVESFIMGVYAKKEYLHK